MMVNGIPSNRTNLDNKKNTVHNSNDIVLVNGIVSDTIVAKTDHNHWLTTQDLFAAENKMSDDSTYHGACP